MTHFGDWERLCDPAGGSKNLTFGSSLGNSAGELSAWMCVSPDKKEALITAVSLNVHANPNPHYLRLRGLDGESIYHCRENGQDYHGSFLMNAGILLPLLGEYEACCLHLKRKENAGA